MLQSVIVMAISKAHTSARALIRLCVSFFYNKGFVNEDIIGQNKEC